MTETIRDASSVIIILLTRACALILIALREYFCFKNEWVYVQKIQYPMIFIQIYFSCFLCMSCYILSLDFQ